MSRTVLVFAGGADLLPGPARTLPKPDLVVAADSGVDRALNAGFRVDVAVGDFDSVTATGFVEIETAGAEIVRHPAVKNETDLELAMLHAMAQKPARIVVASVDGGRLDHQIANFNLLSDRRFSTVMVDAITNSGYLSVVHDQRSLTGKIGDLVSLLPVAGDAVGVTTNGLEYPLIGETLPHGSPRGISNVMVAPVAVVSVQQGVLLAVRSW